jgi:hypothetical protein
MPAIAAQHALERLLLVLHTKRRHSRVGKVHGAPAEGCLQFHERWLQIEALPGVANRECPGKEIEISLVQPEQLLVSQSRCDHDVTQRPKAIVAGVIDECPRLFRLKWLDLVANGARRFHKSRDVAVHLFPFLRLPECRLMARVYCTVCGYRLAAPRPLRTMLRRNLRQLIAV